MVRDLSSDRTASLADRFRAARRSSVSVMFAAGAIPMIGLVGLAVDFGIWNQTNATLSVAANVAAITAVRIAANGQVGNDNNFQKEGVQAGDQYFAAEAGINGIIGTENVNNLTSDQTGCGGMSGTFTCITTGPTTTASVAYKGTVPSVFGFAMFGFVSYPISGSATAVVTTAPFLNVVMMLDDSSSMQIGATNQDIITMQSLTPCASVPTYPSAFAPGAFYPTGPAGNVYNSGNLQGQNYNAYATNGYNGMIPTPAAAPMPPLGYPAYLVGSNNTFQQNPPGSAPNQTCTGNPAGQAPGQPLYLDTKLNPPTLEPVLAGPPCAFACHFDPAPAGTGNDFYGLARSTIGKPNQVTLRFDLLKQATNNVISAMQADNLSFNNLQVGIYSFSTATTRAYPDPSCGNGPTCEAGYDWSTAAADVGGPSAFPNGADTGIQPSYTPTSANTGDTNFHTDMVALKAQVSPSGDGTQQSSPRKVLFLVTDGMSDTTGARTISPVDPNDCAMFKNAPYNYTVYVVYTPYYPLMNAFYIGTMKGYAEPLIGSPVYNAMQACASTPADFISATDGPTLNAALQTFLKQALNSPARFTQ